MLLTFQNCWKRVYLPCFPHLHKLEETIVGKLTELYQTIWVKRAQTERTADAATVFTVFISRKKQYMRTSFNMDIAE